LELKKGNVTTEKWNTKEIGDITAGKWNPKKLGHVTAEY